MSSRPDRSGKTRAHARHRRRASRPPAPARAARAAPGPPGASPSGHLLDLKLRHLEGVIPVRRQDPALLVVPREAPDLRLDELQASFLAQILGMVLEMDLEAGRPPNQAREVLRDRELHALRHEDLLEAASRREAHARDPESVP